MSTYVRTSGDTVTVADDATEAVSDIPAVWWRLVGYDEHERRCPV